MRHGEVRRDQLVAVGRVPAPAGPATGEDRPVPDDGAVGNERDGVPNPGVHRGDGHLHPHRRVRRRDEVQLRDRAARREHARPPQNRAQVSAHAQGRRRRSASSLKAACRDGSGGEGVGGDNRQRAAAAWASPEQEGPA